MKLLRVVVREDFSMERATVFLRDLRDTVSKIADEWREDGLLMLCYWHIQLKTLDDTPQVVLAHEAEKHVATNEQKHARSHKYVMSTQSYSPISCSPSTVVSSFLARTGHVATTDGRRGRKSFYPIRALFLWLRGVLNVLSVSRRHHHKEKHSLAGTTDKTHAVSVLC